MTHPVARVVGILLHKERQLHPHLDYEVLDQVTSIAENGVGIRLFTWDGPDTWEAYGRDGAMAQTYRATTIHLTERDLRLAMYGAEGLVARLDALLDFAVWLLYRPKYAFRLRGRVRPVEECRPPCAPRRSVSRIRP